MISCLKMTITQIMICGFSTRGSILKSLVPKYGPCDTVSILTEKGTVVNFISRLARYLREPYYCFSRVYLKSVEAALKKQVTGEILHMFALPFTYTIGWNVIFYQMNDFIALPNPKTKARSLKPPKSLLYRY